MLKRQPTPEGLPMSQPPTREPQPGSEPSEQLTAEEQPVTAQPVTLQVQPVAGPTQQFGLGLMVMVGVLAAALGIALGVVLGAGREPSTTAVPAATVTVTAMATVTTTVEAEPTDQPTKQPKTTGAFNPRRTDFQIGIKILQKTCLGSAGCTVSFTIAPTYVGSQPLPSTGTIQVTYSILGAEDPIENTFSIVNGQATYDKEEVASTSSSDVKLSAQVLDVVYTP
jgi:hypothetical protein